MENKIQPENDSPFDRLVKEREAEGWGYVGMDTLKETKYEDGLFVERQVRTQDEIKEKHKERLVALVRQAGQKLEVEVDLVAKPNDVDRGIEVPNKFGTYFVFARVKK